MKFVQKREGICIYILAADWEQNELNEMIVEIRKVFPKAQLCGETEFFKAAEWSRKLAEEGKTLEYAFLDICMEKMNGLELARQIKLCHPKVKLIFYTSNKEYAFEAMGLFAKGYLLKPVRAEDIVRTLDAMVHDWRNTLNQTEPEIRMQTFGHFECFVNERPLSFEREKARELLAYLVDRHGAAVTTQQIALVLWEDRPYDKKLKNYVATVVKSLKSTLSAAGVEDLLIKTYNHLSIDVAKFKCDAYDYEKYDTAARNAFRGEYMINYSWAEFTGGRYIQMELEDKK